MPKKERLREVASQLVDAVGPVRHSGYIDGKSELKDALADIIDEPAEAASVLKTLQAQGFVRFVNRVGQDPAEAHWRLIKNPVLQ